LKGTQTVVLHYVFYTVQCRQHAALASYVRLRTRHSELYIGADTSHIMRYYHINCNQIIGHWRSA